MYKALKSFSGLVSMVEGEVMDILNQEVVKDLLSAGYIEEIHTEKKATVKKGKKTPVKGG